MYGILDLKNTDGKQKLDSVLVANENASITPYVWFIENHNGIAIEEMRYTVEADDLSMLETSYTLEEFQTLLTENNDARNSTNDSELSV